MATINSAQKSIHLPLPGLTSKTPSRVLMCSASVGVEGSVTLQLRDSNSSSFESDQSSTSTPPPVSLDNALTTGYPDPDMLADVLGTLQTASLNNGNNSRTPTQGATTNAVRAETERSPSIINFINNNNSNNSNKTFIDDRSTTPTIINSNTNNNVLNKILINRRPTVTPNSSSGSLSSPLSAASTVAATLRTTGKESNLSKASVQTVSTATNTINKTNSYIKNCLIRSSSCGSNTANVTSLAQIMSNSSTTTSANQSSQTYNNNNNSNSSNLNTGIKNINSHNLTLNNLTANSNSNSNDSLFSATSNSSHNSSTSGPTSSNSTSNSTSISAKANSSISPPIPSTSAASAAASTSSTGKKNRSKLLSPTRHGPQQCQICSKIFGNASALAKHKLTHSDERKYVCAMCSKAFKRQDHLNGHMMTHRNKKPYECKAEGCGKSYCDARSLRRHTENHHVGIVTPQNLQSLSPIADTPPLGQSLSPATASGDASSPDGATCIRTYVTTDRTTVFDSRSSTGSAPSLSDEHGQTINLPVKTGIGLVSPTRPSSSASSDASTTTNINTATTTTTISLSDGSSVEGEGLTREQLDIISKIMQQTNQTRAQVTVTSPTSVNTYKVNNAGSITTAQNSAAQPRPRTWNMQLLNTSQNVSIALDDPAPEIATGPVNASPINGKVEERSTNNNKVVAGIDHLNIAKTEQKPVECNLCHRKFKNVPALNGHMRLHGGYFKKDSETKKTDRKETSGPPLQTASIGVRALIEEKIINKRKGAFIVPAPPSGGSGGRNGNNGSNGNCNGTSGSTTAPKRSIGNMESFLSPKLQSKSANATAASTSGTTTITLPAVTTIKSGINGSGSGLSIQQIGLPSSIEICNAKEQKTVNTSMVNSVSTIKMSSPSVSVCTTTAKSTSTDIKDSTLIELLKRGTRVAVTSKKPSISKSTIALYPTTNGNTNALTAQQSAQPSLQIVGSSNNNNKCAIFMPSEVQMMPSRSKLATALTQPSIVANNSISPSNGMPPLSLTLPEAGGSIGSNSNSHDEVYTLTYSNDGDGLFDNGDAYSISDTEMLLQTVESMQLLPDDNDALTTQIKTEHSEEFTLSTGLNHIDAKTTPPEFIKVETDINSSVSMDNNMMLSNMNESHQTLAGSLPTFQEFHSKEIIMQNDSQIFSVSSMRSSCLTLPSGGRHQHASLAPPTGHSCLEYSALTPPSSHGNASHTHTSPFVDDNQRLNEPTNAFFPEKCNTDFLIQSDEGLYAYESMQAEAAGNAKSGNVLDESPFDISIKVEDLFGGSQHNSDCDLREFAETNLSFLDGDQEFLNGSENASSPLPESFFADVVVPCSSANETKETLRELLPTDGNDGNLNSNENIIDLYYLPDLAMQSMQMMSSSDDPLLSSSPKEIGQQQQNPQHIAMAGPSGGKSSIYIEQMQQAVGGPLQHQPQVIEGIKQQPQQPASGLEQTDTAMAMSEFSHGHANQTNRGDGNQLTGQSEKVLDNSHSHSNSVCDMQNVLQVDNRSRTETQFLMTADYSPRLSNNTNIDSMLMQPPMFCPRVNSRSNNISVHAVTDFLSAGTIQDAANIFFASRKNAAVPSRFVSLESSDSTAVIKSVISTLQPLSNQTNSILKRRLRMNGSSDSNLPTSYSKYHALSPYRSKLRRPSRTHYTPAPILDPERKGAGLYSGVLKKLTDSLLLIETLDDEPDDDSLGLLDFSNESKVNLGSAYQAQIPMIVESVDQDENENAIEIEPDDMETEEKTESGGAELMWHPDVQTDEKVLMRYIDLSKSAAVPLGSHSEEVALEALLKAEGNTAAAVLTLLQTPSKSFQMKWSAREMEIFLKGLERYGKNFRKIALKMRKKTTGDCVQMYYFWKKLCVDYKSSHLRPLRTSSSSNNSNSSNSTLKVSNGSNDSNDSSRSSKSNSQTAIAEIRPYVCDLQECSASFTSKAALQGHMRIHGKTPCSNCASAGASEDASDAGSPSSTALATATNTSTTNATQLQLLSQPQTATGNNAPLNAQNPPPPQKDPNITDPDIEYPCKVCGKVFSKVKSRSAHMKTHRSQDSSGQDMSVHTVHNAFTAMQLQTRPNQKSSPIGEREPQAHGQEQARAQQQQQQHEIKECGKTVIKN